MKDDFVPNPLFQIRLVRLTSLVAFIALFWREVQSLMEFLWNVLLILSEQSVFLLLNSEIWAQIQSAVVSAFTLETGQALIIVAASLVAYVLVYRLMLFWVAYFLLPVRSFADQKKAYKRLLAYSHGEHGPAIFVQEGKWLGEKKEIDNTKPGVALVDLSSAIVLERQSGGDAASGDEEDVPVKNKKTRGLIFHKKAEPNPLMRVEGPGLVFTESGEKVKETVDLRKQFRRLADVNGYTRDGIEFTTSISAIFSLSELPDTFLVTYVGERKSENLRAVIIEKSPRKETDTKDFDSSTENTENDSTGSHQQSVVDHILVEKVVALYELEARESKEIHTKLTNQNLEQVVQNSAGAIADKSPFLFDTERVSCAVYNQPSAIDINETVSWRELPCMVALEIFRNMLAQYTFDDLYKREDDAYGNFPLQDLKRLFSFRVKISGLIGWQYVQRRDGKVIQAEDLKQDLTLLPEIRPLQSSSSLRSCGIKIIASSFSELKPVRDDIEEELFNNWKSKWEKEIESILAERDLEAARVRNRARAEIQSGSVHSLSRIFDKTPYTDEAYVVRVFQALETAATDPGAARLLPRDTINMLWNLYRWLLSDGMAAPPDENEDSGGMLPDSQNIEPGGP